MVRCVLLSFCFFLLAAPSGEAQSLVFDHTRLQSLDKGKQKMVKVSLQILADELVVANDGRAIFRGPYSDVTQRRTVVRNWWGWPV